VTRRFQDVELWRTNTVFRLARYHSPSHGKVLKALLSARYAGEFGPSLHAICLTLHWDTNTVSAPISLSGTPA